MGTLLERLRAQREHWVKVGKYQFLLRRPNRLEMQRMPKDYLVGELVTMIIFDWKGVTEQDLFSGGSDQTVEFDRDVWAEWIADHPDFWGAIIDEFNVVLLQYKAQQEDATKN